MSDPKIDPDMQQAVNDLGNALSAAAPGATSSDILAVIDAIDTLMDVKIAQFIEMAADRVAERVGAA